MKKIICIGDIHGKIVWKDIDPEKYDRIIFIGDYVDDYNFTDDEIIENLRAIIKFKKQYFDKVILLLGNHDIQYLYKRPNLKCSGYRNSYSFIISHLFIINKKCFKTFWSEGEYGTNNFYLFSHAGFSHSFCDENNISFVDEGMVTGDLNCFYNIGHARGGDSQHGGVFWADKSELEQNYLPHIHQVVGHSKVADIVTYGNQEGSITFIDVLDTNVKFYEITI